MQSKTIVYGPTRDANIKLAYDWLDRALRLEADGKSANIVNMALDRACDYENYAFTLPAE